MGEFQWLFKDGQGMLVFQITGLSIHNVNISISSGYYYHIFFCLNRSIWSGHLLGLSQQFLTLTHNIYFWENKLMRIIPKFSLIPLKRSYAARASSVQLCFALETLWQSCKIYMKVKIRLLPASVFFLYSRFRKICYRICNHSYFGNVVLGCILISSGMLAAEDPLDSNSARNKVYL